MNWWPVILALPWWGVAIAALARARRSTSLDYASPTIPEQPPLISVVVPARNEERNLRACVRSVLASEYPRLEVIIVDDRSEDATPAIAQQLAADPRVSVVQAPPLPEGWFGKQWACECGAKAATGQLLCFADADTRHAPDLLPRAINTMRERGADLLSPAGRQELGGFWERVVQPQVFSLLVMRYGGTELINRSLHVADKIANGQCILITREAYQAVGGHASVRRKVAEDLALAQRAFAEGRVVVVVLATEQLATRMYTSLGEIVGGWMKNIYAGALEATPGGAPGRAMLPLFLLVPVLLTLAPPAGVVAGLLGFGGWPVVLWGLLASAAILFWLVPFGMIFLDLPVWYTLLFPLGALVLLYIILRAVARGRRVRWKGRDYRAG